TAITIDIPQNQYTLIPRTTLAPFIPLGFNWQMLSIPSSPSSQPQQQQKLLFLPSYDPTNPTTSALIRPSSSPQTPFTLAPLPSPAVYDVGSDSWTRIDVSGSGPSYADGASCLPVSKTGDVESGVYCFGGRVVGIEDGPAGLVPSLNVTGRVWYFELKTSSSQVEVVVNGTWRLLEQQNSGEVIPSPRYGSAVALVNGTILVMWGGGAKNSNMTASTLSDSPEMDQPYGDSSLYFFDTTKTNWVDRSSLLSASITNDGNSPNGGSRGGNNANSNANGNGNGVFTEAISIPRWAIIPIVFGFVLVLAVCLVLYIRAKRAQTNANTARKGVRPSETGGAGGATAGRDCGDAVGAGVGVGGANEGMNYCDPDPVTNLHWADRTSRSRSLTDDHDGT
ncbi:hypothetical protein HK102_011452, partial [Quaeritorhiza haematococci]